MSIGLHVPRQHGKRQHKERHTGATGVRRPRPEAETTNSHRSHVQEVAAPPSEGAELGGRSVSHSTDREPQGSTVDNEGEERPPLMAPSGVSHGT